MYADVFLSIIDRSTLPMSTRAAVNHGILPESADCFLTFLLEKTVVATTNLHGKTAHHRNDVPRDPYT